MLPIESWRVYIAMFQYCNRFIVLSGVKCHHCPFFARHDTERCGQIEEPKTFPWLN